MLRNTPPAVDRLAAKGSIVGAQKPTVTLMKTPIMTANNHDLDIGEAACFTMCV